MVQTIIELSGLLLIIAVGLYAVVLQGLGDASRLTQIDPGDSTALLAVTGATGLAFFAASSASCTAAGGRRGSRSCSPASSP